MALSRKRQLLYDLFPDISIIPECAKKCVELCIEDGFDGRWIGDKPQKGLGVLVATVALNLLLVNFLAHSWRSAMNRLLTSGFSFHPSNSPWQLAKSVI